MTAPRAVPDVSYRSYLRLPELLDQQAPASSPPAHDELLFIVAHQAYELWFKAVLFELSDARDLLLAGRAHRACDRLRRCLAIERLLVDQLDVLDTMTPHGFGEFRHVLGSASGFQSVQFREIEFLSGAKDPAYVDRTPAAPEERARLRRRLAEPSLWDGFLATLAAAGFDAHSPEGREKALATIAADREGYAAVAGVADLLVAHDRSWALWRARHALLAERQIGARPGTGGSDGAAYLHARAGLRFYPDLWAL